MYKDSTVKYIDDTRLRLKEANTSIYKISRILGEPEPTIHNILKAKTTKYSEDRVNLILDRINSYLNELAGIQATAIMESKIKIPEMKDCPEIFENNDLYTKLFELGLNSRVFSPEEKLHFAIWHRTLTAYKNKLKNQSTENENPK